MPTRNELILQFMTALASNGNVPVLDAPYVYKVACGLADEYIKSQG
jgi:hypothetical protein